MPCRRDDTPPLPVRPDAASDAGEAEDGQRDSGHDRDEAAGQAQDQDVERAPLRPAPPGAAVYQVDQPRGQRDLRQAEQEEDGQERPERIHRPIIVGRQPRERPGEGVPVPLSS